MLYGFLSQWSILRPHTLTAARNDVYWIRRPLPLNFLLMLYWNPYQLRRPMREQVKHPNFGGFSQGI